MGYLEILGVALVKQYTRFDLRRAVDDYYKLNLWKDG